MAKSKAQKIREEARKVYDNDLISIENERYIKTEKSYNIYCDALDEANKLDGKPRVKR